VDFVGLDLCKGKEEVKVSILAWTYIIVGITFALYIFIAVASRVKDVKGFYVAGASVPALANGMATGADWMSAASFISMAGLISFMGYTGCVYLMGWTGGYVLLALLLAPYLRKFGKYTVPDFVGDRYYSSGARSVALTCAIFVSFTYVAGQMRGVGIVFSRFLQVDVNTGVIIGVAIVFVYAVLGGMKGITWTQVAQYWVLILAYLIPAWAISTKITGMPIPQIGFGSTISEGPNAGLYLLDVLDKLNTDLGFAAYTSAFGAGNKSMIDVFCITFALMVGTAGLPHVIIRFYTVPSVKAARISTGFALMFIAILYTTAPSVASFARYNMIETLNDKPYSRTGRRQASLPGWTRITTASSSTGRVALLRARPRLPRKKGAGDKGLSPTNRPTAPLNSMWTAISWSWPTRRLPVCRTGWWHWWLRAGSLQPCLRHRASFW
jgi:cation/acetate symporter